MADFKMLFIFLSNLNNYPSIFHIARGVYLSIPSSSEILPMVLLSFLLLILNLIQWNTCGTGLVFIKLKTEAVSIKNIRETGSFHRLVFSIAANEGNKGIYFPPLTDAEEPWTAPEELWGSTVWVESISTSRGKKRSW